ncbi:hypothetical protein RHSIM_Rhsim05G0021600 [Rhododendron simsii]|uniref:Uncharacterized protein n=1 Tax=Rhododendron simsii TaxID=118357 RepID=A0A834GV64_RHOSS|nr:hypothetical protein RHSIM_Rhsim05G0021600 [Rhododendron simsii]
MAMSPMLQDICTFVFAAPSSFVARVLVEIPHLRDVMVPVGCTLTAAVVAWLVIPLILKSCYNESIKGTQVTPSAPFPYKASYWGALEDPLRCLICFFALSLAGYLIAPRIVSNYVLPAWKGAMMASFVLFLQRWKRSAFPHAFAVMVVNEADRINLAKLDTLFSKGIFGLGLLALAAAAGVSMLYISWITVAGEWVVLLADKDSNQNLYNGYYMRTSKLVKVGDFVKTLQCQQESESYVDSIRSEILGVFDWKEM